MSHASVTAGMAIGNGPVNATGSVSGLGTRAVITTIGMNTHGTRTATGRTGTGTETGTVGTGTGTRTKTGTVGTGTEIQSPSTISPQIRMRNGYRCGVRVVDANTVKRLYIQVFHT